MKQRKFGQKIQNWHRPLGRNDFRRRYLRNRFEDSDAKHEIDGTNEWRESNLEFVSSCPDESECPYCYPQTLDEFVRDHRVINFLNDSLARNAMLPEWLACRINQGYSNQPVETEPEIHKVEERLIRYASILKPDASESIIETIAPTLENPSEVDAIKRHCKVNTALAQNILLFSPFWIRRPTSFSGGSTNELLDHLFVKYSIPEFLFNGWRSIYLFDDTKWKIWFLAMAQGASLYRISRRLKWDVTQKLIRNLSDSPSSLRPSDAALLALIRSKGGSDRVYRWLQMNRSFVIDPTEMELEGDGFREFWFDTVVWLVKHEDHLRDHDAYQILDWAFHRYLEAYRIFDLWDEPPQVEATHRPFQMKNRSCRRVVELSREYANRFVRQRGHYPSKNYKWEPKGWDWELTDGLNHWEVVELTSSEQLYKDGAHHNHCVAGYVHHCLEGTSSIFSLKMNNVPMITIELNPKSKQVVQARGHRNRAPQKLEEQIINKWKIEVFQS